ncbi:MAG: hypothetical protein RSD49_18015 [Hafnia sp.]
MKKLHINQIWRDNKAVGSRYVQIVGPEDKDGRVSISTFYRGDVGELPVEVKNAGRFTSRADRFNDKRDGYTFVADSQESFLEQKLHLADFVKGPALAQPALASVSQGISDVLMYLPSMAPGEIWREAEPRYARFVEILGMDAAGERNQIVTRYFTETDGDVPVATPAAKPTYAKRERFNGKRRGYVFVARSLDALEGGAELSVPFAVSDSSAQQAAQVEPSTEALPNDSLSEPGAEIAVADVPSGASTIVESVATASAADGQAKVSDVVESLVSIRQLWQDGQAPLVRLVEVVAINGDLVEVASRYVQDTVYDRPRRVQLHVSEEVPLEAFQDSGRFRYVTSV